MNYDNSALHLSTTDAEKFVDIMINPSAPSENLKKLLQDQKDIPADFEKVIADNFWELVSDENAGTYKVRTRQEWSDLLKELNIDWC